MRLSPSVFVVLAISALLAGCGEPASAPEGVHENTASIEPQPLDPGAPEAEQAALASCGPVTGQGYCGVTFGMAPKDARAHFPVDLEGYADYVPQNRAEADRCFEMFPVEPVQGVSFLVERQMVGRVDFLTEAAKTADGFGIGTTVEEIKGRFGAAATETPNKYEPEVVDLAVAQGSTKFVFEIQDGKVRGWRAGVAPTIDYTEHCG
jgi:hypothetical protein